MKILVTGAKGFVGKNLVARLETIRDKKDRTRPQLTIEEIYSYDIDSDKDALSRYCKDADFVFHLAGVNRPQSQEEFMQGNFGFSSLLLDALKAHGNRCPVMLSSSVQASLVGRYADGEYGKSKKAGEELFFNYAKETGGQVCVYRFPNLFGKWCRPNYNSVIATFCHNVAHDLDITIHDPLAELELLYIDDLVEGMLDLLEGKASRCDYVGVDAVKNPTGAFYYVPNTHKVTVGKIAELLSVFDTQTKTLVMPEIPKDSFEKKLYSTYLSYLPKEKVKFSLSTNTDERGSFTELLKSCNCGQFSVNVSNPGVVKGQHWHNTKWEFFIVVSGRALIQQRKIGSEEVLNFEVSGEKIEAVHMLPGYTHNIINLSDTEKLITLMWANECFDKEKPDTFFEKVE